MLHLRIAARQRIPYNNYVRPAFPEVLRMETFEDPYTKLVQEIGHWWIYIRIRTGYCIAPRVKHPCQRGHGCAADTDQVELLNFFHFDNRSLNDRRFQKLEKRSTRS